MPLGMVSPSPGAASESWSDPRGGGEAHTGHRPENCGSSWSLDPEQNFLGYLRALPAGYLGPFLKGNLGDLMHQESYLGVVGPHLGVTWKPYLKELLGAFNWRSPGDCWRAGT